MHHHTIMIGRKIINLEQIDYDFIIPFLRRSIKINIKHFCLIAFNLIMKELIITQITENLIQPLQLSFGYDQTSNFQKVLVFQDVKFTITISIFVAKNVIILSMPQALARYYHFIFIQIKSYISQAFLVHFCQVC